MGPTGLGGSNMDANVMISFSDLHFIVHEVWVGNKMTPVYPNCFNKNGKKSPLDQNVESFKTKTLWGGFPKSVPMVFSWCSPGLFQSTNNYQ